MGTNKIIKWKELKQSYEEKGYFEFMEYLRWEIMYGLLVHGEVKIYIPKEKEE